MEKSVNIRNVEAIKNRLVDSIIGAGTVFGILTFFSSLFPFSTDLINADFYFDVIGLSTLLFTYFFRTKLNLMFKSNIIIAILFIIYISDVFENGLETPDTVLIVLIPFLSILVYNFWVTVCLYVASIGIYLIIGYLFISGTVTSNFYDASNDSFFRWVEVALVLSVVTVMITLFLNRFHLTVYKLIKDLESQKNESVARESLLSAITKNIPLTTLTVIDKDLTIKYTDGNEYSKWNLNPVDYIGINALETLQIFGDENVAKMEKAYQLAFEGMPQLERQIFENEHLLYKILPFENHKGEIDQLLVVTENITEKIRTDEIIKNSMEEKTVLLQEIHHRVKNNLAIVSGLLSLQSFNINDPNSKFILEKSTNRIMSIAKVHEMLYESQNFNRIPFDRYVKELSTIILDSMNQDEKSIQFNTDIDVEFISINHGVPLGIIFNELITNSIKYGFNGEAGNRIDISVRLIDDEFKVMYQDNGVGIEDFETASSKSLGFTLIQSLMQQIEATFKYDTLHKFKLIFTFPAEISEASIPVTN